MNAFSKVRLGLDLWARAEIAGAIGAILALVALVLTQIFLRAFAAPLVWAEEAGVYIFFWLIFLAAPAAYKYFLHIRVGVFDGLSFRVRRVAVWLANLVVLLVAVIILWHAPTAISLDLRSSTTSLPFVLPRALFFSGPLTYAMASIAITAAIFTVIGVPDSLREDAKS